MSIREQIVMDHQRRNYGGEIDYVLTIREGGWCKTMVIGLLRIKKKKKKEEQIPPNTILYSLLKNMSICGHDFNSSFRKEISPAILADTN